MKIRKKNCLSLPLKIRLANLATIKTKNSVGSRQIKITISLIILIVGLMGVWSVMAATQSEQEAASESEAQVMQKFTSEENIKSDIVTIDDQRKRQVMFAMGVPLLLFIIITVALGIAMGVFGKDVYIPHMIFAGLSLTLALAHSIVGLVWFWPF